MNYAVEKISSMIDAEVSWLEKLNEEKCDIDKVVSKLRKSLRIIKRYYVECERYEEYFMEEIEDLENSILDIISLNMVTKTYKRMILRLLEQIKRNFISKYEYSSNYYPFISDLTSEEIEKICNIKCLSNRKLNVFFPNIDDTKIFSNKFKDKFNVYASSTDEDDYSSLKNYADYRILGELKIGSFITNNAFDVLVLRPRLESNYNRVKDSEKMDILNVLKYLREDGVFVLNIPYSRCTDEILLLLSKKIENIKVAKICTRLEKTIFIVGNKVSFKSNDDSSCDYNKLISLFELNYYKDFDEEIDFLNYSVPSDEIEVTFFRGSKVSKEEMCDYCANSGLIDSFFKESSSDETIDRHPLLPFNIGQVGLVLTSSELNGVVEDDNGIPHLIKGMTVKDTNRSEEHEGSEIRSTEVVANRVQINIMSADGKIIKIS